MDRGENRGGEEWSVGGLYTGGSYAARLDAGEGGGVEGYRARWGVRAGPGLLEGYEWDVPLGVGAGGSVVGLREGDLVRHVVVYGMVGYGKTTLVKRLVYEASLRLGAGFLVVDWEGEYLDVAGAVGARVLGGRGGEPLRLGLFEPPPGVDVAVYAEWVSSTLAGLMADEGWDVTPQMEAVLRDAVRVAVEEGVGVDGFLDVVREAAAGRWWGKATAAGLDARLSRLFRGPLRGVLGGGGGLPLGGRVVVDLSWVSGYSRSHARFLARLVLARVYYWAALRGGSGPLFLVVVEEAEEVAPAPGWGRRLALRGLVLDMMHLRKRRVGVVVVAHSPSMLDPSVARLAGTVAAFRLGDADDARVVGARLGVEAEVLQGLDVGEAVVRPAGARGFFYVKVEPPPLLDGAALRLLESVREAPYLTTRERRSLLGMKGSEYARAVHALLAAGLVRKVTVNTGAGRPVVLLEATGANPGAAHSFLVHRARLAARAFLPGARVEEPGDADLSIGVCGGSIAVEAETGTNIDAGKYLRLRGRYDYLLVLCIDRRCLRSARRALVNSEWTNASQAILLRSLPHALREAASRVCARAPRGGGLAGVAV